MFVLDYFNLFSYVCTFMLIYDLHISFSSHYNLWVLLIITKVFSPDKSINKKQLYYIWIVAGFNMGFDDWKYSLTLKRVVESVKRIFENYMEQPKNKIIPTTKHQWTEEIDRKSKSYDVKWCDEWMVKWCVVCSSTIYGFWLPPLKFSNFSSTFNIYTVGAFRKNDQCK